MTTIVNNPTPTNDEGGNNFTIQIILIAVFVVILFYFGIPAIRHMGPIQVNTPPPQVTVPGKIDVNVKQTK